MQSVPAAAAPRTRGDIGAWWRMQPNNRRYAWIAGGVVALIVVVTVLPSLIPILVLAGVLAGAYALTGKSRRAIAAQQQALSTAFAGEGAPVVSQRHLPPSWTVKPSLAQPKPPQPTGDAIALDVDGQRLWFARYDPESHTVWRRAYGAKDILAAEIREHTETVNQQTSHVRKDDTITKKSTSGIVGRGLVGKAVGGNLGAAAAGLGAKERTRGGHETIDSTQTSRVMVSSLTLQMRLADVQNPLAIIEFLPTPAPQASAAYFAARAQAERWYAVAELLMKQKETEKKGPETGGTPPETSL